MECNVIKTMCFCCFLNLSLKSTLAGDDDPPDLDTFPIVADPQNSCLRTSLILEHKKSYASLFQPQVLDLFSN